MVGLMALFPSHPARAQQFQQGSVYQNWATAEPASMIDTWMWPMMANDGIYFAQTFRFDNHGSYMGLQQGGDGSRRVRFSIWNATDSRASTVEGAACRPFGGEGDGMTCMIPYAWETGRWYRLRIWMLESDAEANWWAASVMDDSGLERRIGDIRAPGPSLIKRTSTFNEYFGPAAGLPCGQPRPSALFVYQPLVNGDNSRATAVGGSLLECAGGRVAELWNGELARLDLHADRVAGPIPLVPPITIDLADGIDLVVHSPRADYDRAGPEQSFELSADVRNLGTASAAATSLSYYRSNDSTISRDDTRIGVVSIAGLPAAAAVTASLGVRAPPAVGTYYYGACVDGVRAERNANNNCSVGVPVIVMVDDPRSRSVLMEIYHTMGGPMWTVRTNWLDDLPIWTWHGVETDSEGRVIRLNLRNSGLTGRIPEALKRLPRLENLSLAGNDLTGPIPAWLGQLSSLRYLRLDDTALSGKIPPELGSLTRLGHLSLDRNAGLTGPVPAELGNLTSLWILRLQDTALSGPLPLTMTNLRRLDWLDVRDTRLCAPQDPAFQAWLQTVKTINGGIAPCPDPPEVPISELSALHPDRAQQFQDGVVYQSWAMAEPASTIDTWMWPSMANHAMFFAQTFSIENSGSYLGLEQGGDGSRSVLFSIWNATESRTSSVEGAACRPFGGEGVGMTCTIPYAWETGRWYRLRIRMVESDAEARWWAASVVDDSGLERHVGDIRAPGPGLITSTRTFNVYYGPAEGLFCGQPPPSAVYAYQPLVNDDSSRATAAGGNLLQCSGGRVADLWNGELAGLDLHVSRVAGPTPEVPPVTIDLVDGIDLVAYSPRMDYEGIGPEQSFALSADVRNLGTEAAAATSLGYYRSNDSTISRGDTRIGTVPIVGLSAAGAATASLAVGAPEAVGTYYYGVCVDGVPAESNADNNCSAGVMIDDPRSALVEVYRATGGPTWKTSTNWLSDQPISAWHGVETDAAGRVTRLNLRSNGLTGRIPDALRRLPLLEDLVLASNDLTGPIPAWLGQLPSLQKLWLDGNDLSGRIPAELGALTRLGHLSLDRNAGLTGPVPAEFGTLTSLWTLRLNRTALAGPLPLTLTNLRSLTYLDMSDTGLCAPQDPAFQAWLQTVRRINGGITNCPN